MNRVDIETAESAHEQLILSAEDKACLEERKWWCFLLSSVCTFVVGLFIILIFRAFSFIFSGSQQTHQQQLAHKQQHALQGQQQQQMLQQQQQQHLQQQHLEHHVQNAGLGNPGAIGAIPGHGLSQQQQLKLKQNFDSQQPPGKKTRKSVK